SCGRSHGKSAGPGTISVNYPDCGPSNGTKVCIPTNTMRNLLLTLIAPCLIAAGGLSGAAQNQQIAASKPADAASTPADAATKPVDDQPVTTLKVQAREVL